MLAAAAKEGKVVWYSSIDVKVAELIAKGLPCRLSEYPDRGRAIGIERVFQRINQEYQSGIKNVDVVQLVRCFAFHFTGNSRSGWRRIPRPT